ncbi:MAG: HAD hydrolase family protein [Bacteroidetes bacterium]|nr:HAD hydrolase family protein [Bacteroidota bacterium]
MGKPFKTELERISQTIEWTNSLRIDELKKKINSFNNIPVLIIGSGGSLSACHYAVLLCQQNGVFAKALTPLDIIYSENLIGKTHLIFISASGKNNDILFGFKNAVQKEPRSITSICMRTNSPLVKLSDKYSISRAFEFDIPSGKDGFLATNSLIAYFIILYKAFGNKIEKQQLDIRIGEPRNEIRSFVNKIANDYSIVVLYGGWGQPVAVDIESKCTESALCNILPSDYRNFGHGRHHWFAKRKRSAIIALITPKEEKLALKTLGELPREIPKLIISSEYDTPYSSIDLLIKSFVLIDELGQMQSIDPGKPGVPEFGRKLYNLRFASSFTIKNNNLTLRATNAIKRKLQIASINNLKSNELSQWIKAYNKFISKLNKTRFGTLVFDYDGTLCSSENRRNGLSNPIISELTRILEAGFIIAIVTGRGKSIRFDMQNAIPNKFWGNIIIGYYNGSQIGKLKDNSMPNTEMTPDKSLSNLTKHLSDFTNKHDVSLTLRPQQLTLEDNNSIDWENTKNCIFQELQKLNLNDLKIVQSGHSIDIIPRDVSKLNIIPHCVQSANNNNLPSVCICIGDKGQWPGNDYELLSTEYSLSVDEVSLCQESCWNIADTGIRNTEATISYLQRIQTKEGFMQFKITK